MTKETTLLFKPSFFKLSSDLIMKVLLYVANGVTKPDMWPRSVRRGNKAFFSTQLLHLVWKP